MTYCSKDETRAPGEGNGPFFFGEGPADKGGKREDVLGVKRRLDDGEELIDIAKDEAHFEAIIRYERGFSWYARGSQQVRSAQTTCVVYYGPPGSGKTRRATEDCAGRTAYWLTKPNATNGSLWWDGYTGQNTTVIDEFYGWIPRDLLQRLVDRTPLTVQVKGGSVQFTSEKVILTSNVHPKYWWKNIGLGAMLRRLQAPIGEVVYIGNEQFPTAEDWELERLNYVHQ